MMCNETVELSSELLIYFILSIFFLIKIEITSTGHVILLGFQYHNWNLLQTIFMIKSPTLFSNSGRNSNHSLVSLSRHDVSGSASYSRNVVPSVIIHHLRLNHPAQRVRGIGEG